MLADILVNNWFDSTQQILVWLHVFAGILWIGHLYFFNFVNANFQPKLDKEIKQKVNPQLLPRALFWFRWGAMITFLAGLALFTLIYMYDPGTKEFGPSGAFRETIKSVGADGAVHEATKLTGRAIWIMVGMACGFVMWFNVWFVIWPRQQKIIRAVRDGQAPDAAMVKTAGNASKLNTYLSGPMLMGMLAPSHSPGANIPTVIIGVLIGLAVVFHVFMVAPKVGTDIGQNK